MQEPPEDAEQEVIISELGPSDEPRQLWIYDPRDDYKITIPAGSRVTFGYFNPAVPQVRERNAWSNGPGSDTMKTTCLRVYADSTDKRQIAAFLGVTGFRDMSLVTKEVMRRKVTIETNVEDDGLGNVNKAHKQLVAPQKYNEDEVIPL